MEATSGNTGMGLALAAAVKGYRTVFTLPDKMSNGEDHGSSGLSVPRSSSPPRQSRMILPRVTRKSRSASCGRRRTRSSRTSTATRRIQNRTTSPPGPRSGIRQAAQITYFVCGIGTGGTISGAGKYLKEKNPGIRVIGVDPKGSVLREYFYTEEHQPCPQDL